MRLDSWHMLSEKQFRERAKTELRQIGNEVLGLATDRDVYWKLESEIIQPNPQLRDAHHAFLDLLRGNYCEAMTARALRLLNSEDSGTCLARVLTQIAEYPELLQDRVTEREFADDRAALEQAADNLKRIDGPRIAHHERTLSALAGTHRELDAAIDLLTLTAKTYYWIVADSYLDLEVKYQGDPLEIFRMAWATATVGVR
jgi:hypothetical protein